MQKLEFNLTGFLLIFMIVETLQSGKYWTFGSNDGRGCESKHGWCPSQVAFNSSFWKSGFPNNIFTKRCIAFTFSKGAIANYMFEDEICTQVLPFVCEVGF
jgi:hypothetical protein